jgi:hypothetical protein
VSGRTSATPGADGACKLVVMQIAINGQSLQSAGAESSGQHSWSAGIDAGSSAMGAIAIDPCMPVFARAESGATTRPTIKRSASTLQRWIERFTGTISHRRPLMGSQVPSRNRRFSLTQTHCDASYLRWIKLHSMDGGYPQNAPAQEQFRTLRLEW